MKNSDLPTPGELRRRLRYDPITGLLFWRRLTDGDPREMARFNAKHAGREAFTHIGSGGYRRGGINGRQYTAHRVIWAMTNDEWPPNDIDHINGVRDDNRIANLRAVTRSENTRNLKMDKRNKSGATGVFYLARDDVWIAHIGDGGKPRHLGRFRCIEDAVNARRQAELALGYHKNHGSAERA